MMDATRTSTLANDWLKDFCLALKNVSLYSADHPRGKEYLERAYESLRAAMGQKREAALTRAESRLHFDQILLDRDITLAAQLAEDLDARRVDSLVFHSTLTPEEHLGFIRALLTKVDRVAEKGGFGQVLIDEGVSSIKVNVERPAPAWGMLESTPAGQATLVDFVLQLSSRQAPKEQAANGNGEPLASQVLAGDAGALMRAILEAAKNRESGPPSGPEAMAEVMADTLERLAERALEEHRRDRHEILLDVGRAVVAADPDTHPTLFLEKAGPRSIRKLLVSAVEGLPPRLIAELVGHHYERAAGDYRKLTEMVNRAHAWRDDREAVSAEVEKRLAASGLSAQRAHECIDHLVWSELSLARRLELLQQADLLWRVDFSRLKEALLKLLATDQIRESTGLIQKYLDALSSDDLEIRRLTADNARHLLQLIDKTGKGLEMLPRMAELFLARLQEEQDPDVVARLAGGLAFLVDLRLRSGNLGEALALMRKVDLLASSGSPTLKERGLKLAEALGRAGSDKMFGKLAEMLLDGNDQSSREAAEILKRGGSRSANYLIERLAEEENRSHRARLVMLLKEMGKGASAPFVSRLDDPRWFLVRNVVGILGDIGDAAVLPHLKTVASHGDPRVRREVVRTYLRLGTPECEDRIIAALADEDRGVQITAASALASIKGKRALGVLLDVARRSGAYEDAAPDVRQEALVSLGKIGAREAVPVLIEIVKRKGLLGHAEPAELRAAAARALGALGSAEAKSTLEELAAKDPRPQVREAAQEALANRGQAAARSSRR